MDDDVSHPAPKSFSSTLHATSRGAIASPSPWSSEDWVRVFSQRQQRCVGLVDSGYILCLGSIHVGWKREVCSTPEEKGARTGGKTFCGIGELVLQSNAPRLNVHVSAAAFARMKGSLGMLLLKTQVYSSESSRFCTFQKIAMTFEGWDGLGYGQAQRVGQEILSEDFYVQRLREESYFSRYVLRTACGKWLHTAQYCAERWTDVLRWRKRWFHLTLTVADKDVRRYFLRLGSAQSRVILPLAHIRF